MPVPTSLSMNAEVRPALSSGEEEVLARSTLRVVRWRHLPFLLLLYVVAWVALALVGGIALINSVGALGAFGGPYIIGLVTVAIGSVAGELIIVAAMLPLSAALVAHLRRDPARSLRASLPAYGERP